ncbi:hypothetical protein Ppro_3358 [Pelobacter propionicus DSM 2379]|uniref:Uncharacterized protein n=1 Tax=Pelobacter propionicus (strain DSM 2379 / NBRC 103807 / OttBd1) TaxID=338966 RepID=A1AUD0_PELPD|nr:hypothetical protein Ppro_3358 [Pelobacter propionicus DSM 2379]
MRGWLRGSGGRGGFLFLNKSAGSDADGNDAQDEDAKNPVSRAETKHEQTPLESYARSQVFPQQRKTAAIRPQLCRGAETPRQCALFS